MTLWHSSLFDGWRYRHDGGNIGVLLAVVAHSLDDRNHRPRAQHVLEFKATQLVCGELAPTPRLQVFAQGSHLSQRERKVLAD